MAEKLEDFNLPSTVVQKIIKEAIPENVNIAKDARTALARAAAVFVLYIASHSSQVAQKSNRKTLVGQDVIEALESLEFEELIEPLKQSLAEITEYKDSIKKKPGNLKAKKPEEEDEDDVVEEIEEEMEDDSPILL